LAFSTTGIPAVDPRRSSSSVKRLLTNVALSGPGTWFYSQVAARIDPPLARLSRGRLTSALGLLPVVLLSTRGARSGLERTVALLYFTDGDDVILMASSFGRPKFPAWYHNLKANPSVRLQAMGRGGHYLACEVEGQERDRLYELAQNLYSGYGVYEQRTSGIRHVPVLRLSPERS
jgi:deazaflavin-dependent oxidoreductase (nitroreductase family)